MSEVALHIGIGQF